MFGDPFYHNTLRKIVASFGSIFANIFVVKRAENGNEIERLKVPLAYGPAERYLARLSSGADIKRGYSIKLPRMSFQLTTIAYDSERKLNTIRKNVKEIRDVNNKVSRQYQGVQYTIRMKVSIISKYIDDANQILEQILPWFTPAFTITLNSISEMSYKDDVPIILTGVSLSDNYEDDWVSRREIVFTLNFDIKTIFYGPIVDKNIITKAITDVYNSTTIQSTNDTDLQAVARVGRATVTPNPPNASINDDYGYTETYEGFFDGKFRNPATGQDVIVYNTITPEVIESEEYIPAPKLK